MSVFSQAPEALEVRLVAAGQSVRMIYVEPGTTLNEIISEYRDSKGRGLSAEDEGSMEYFVNGASVARDYEFVDDNQMLVVVGAVYNG